jgi:hypothetical protein
MIMRLKTFFGFLFLGIYFWNCSISGPLREDPQASQFKMGPRPETWQPLQTTSGGQSKEFQFFKNPKTGATFWVNSICQRYQESKLVDLMEQLKAPFTAVEIQSTEEKKLDGRNSLWLRLKGQVDGVVVENLFVVVRKNSCIFDFTLSSLSSIHSSDHSDFLNWVGGFSYSGE